MSHQEHLHRTRGKSSQQVSCIKPAPSALTDPRRAFHYSDLLTRQIYCRTIVADHRDLNDPDVTPLFTKDPPSAQGSQVEVICTCLRDLHCAFSVSPFTGGSLRAAAHKVTEDHAVLAQGGQVGVTPTLPHDAQRARRPYHRLLQETPVSLIIIPTVRECASPTVAVGLCHRLRQLSAPLSLRSLTRPLLRCPSPLLCFRSNPPFSTFKVPRGVGR